MNRNSHEDELVDVCNDVTNGLRANLKKIQRWLALAALNP